LTRMWGKLGPMKVARKEESLIPRANGFVTPSTQKWGKLDLTKGWFIVPRQAANGKGCTAVWEVVQG
jgi:hypothetical protein